MHLAPFPFVVGSGIATCGGISKSASNVGPQSIHVRSRLIRYIWRPGSVSGLSEGRVVLQDSGLMVCFEHLRGMFDTVNKVVNETIENQVVENCSIP